MATCRIGTSGWNYAHWRGVLYPPGLSATHWLEHYVREFSTVEVNYSFYRLPDEGTFDHWRDQAPQGFIFAVKANRYLTHVKRLKDCAEPLGRFLERARRLETHLGPILYQLPPRWKADPARLAAFGDLLPRDLVHVFEFRDDRWFTEPVRRVLEERALAFCIHDMAGMRCPDWVTAPTVYFRFHGAVRAYAGCYSRQRLGRIAQTIRDQLDRGRDVFAYFNNDAEGHAVRNARQLVRLVDAP